MGRMQTGRRLRTGKAAETQSRQTPAPESRPKRAAKPPKEPREPKPEPTYLPLSLPQGVDVERLLWEGVETKIREGNEQDVLKRGLMRGASQGLFINMETIAGPCHRAAHARMLGGVQPRPADWNEKQLMFDSGLANEDSWVDRLRRSWDGPILREEELPIEWRIQTDDGAEAKGSGREDIILCWPKGEQPAGPYVTMRAADGQLHSVAQFVELKQASSINTVCETMLIGGAPKLEHGIQVGRYTREHRVPAQIWYSLPFVMPVPGWSFLSQYIPAQGTPEAKYVQYGRDGRATKIQPHVVGYRLAWHDDVLHYQRVGFESKGWVPTIITAQGLDDFWRYTLDMPAFKDLGTRPVAMDIHGGKKFYKPCDYCDWRPVCDEHEDDYSSWEKAVLATRIENQNKK